MLVAEAKASRLPAESITLSNMFHSSQQIWLAPDTHTDDITSWATFERRFDLPAVPDRAQFHFFAASRYRLVVNDQIVGYGPARFVPQYAEYANIDLKPFLRPGPNVIEVEVCFINYNSYQHVPDTTGRFIGWGEVEAGGRSLPLSTPGAWKVRRSTACATEVPAYSFAIGPVEVRDTRTGTLSLQTPTVIEPAEQWNFVAPTVPEPSGRLISPSPMFAAALAGGETRVGFISVHPTSHGQWDRPVRGQHFRYVTYLHSTREQSVELGLHWGPHFINGVKIETHDDPVRRMRQNGIAPLKAGWNLLCGEPEQLLATYPLMIGIPDDAGITLHARPDLNETAVMAYQPARSIPDEEKWARTPPNAAGIMPHAAAWRFVEAGQLPLIPARLMAWDIIDEKTRVTNPTWPIVAPNSASEWTIMFDFGTEFLGHPQIVLDADAGTIVDFAYDECLRADGALALFRGNPFVEPADRYVCRGGRQTIEAFYPRGGRYLQITIRSPIGVRPTTLHHMALRDATSSEPFDRPFTSSNELFKWTWQTGIRTLRASSDDVFCDSPWRERGTYLGDSYVQSMVEIVVARNPMISRRALRLFAAAQLPSGQFSNVAPAWYQMPLFDFTLIYAIWLHDYWKLTGDEAIVRDCMHAVDRLLESETWVTSRYSPLWDVPAGGKLFVDWGVDLPARLYNENGVLNAFRFKAVECAASLFAATGDPARSERLRVEAAEIKDAFQTRLWLHQHGRFAGGTADGSAVERETVHVNVLALGFGLASAEQEPALIRYLLGRIPNNAARAISAESGNDYIELYFLKYLLDALVRIDRHDIARQVISDHMSIMRDAGSPTFWESLRLGSAGKGSFCHSWSAAPLIYLAQFANETST